MKEATYSLCAEDVRERAEERGIKLCPATPDEHLVSWLSHKMPDFLEFASGELINACVDNYRFDEEESCK